MDPNVKYALKVESRVRICLKELWQTLDENVSIERFFILSQCFHRLFHSKT